MEALEILVRGWCSEGKDSFLKCLSLWDVGLSYVCIWLSLVLVAGWETFSSCSRWVFSWGMWGSSSLTRDSTWAPCIGSTVLATGPPAKSLYDFVLFFLVEETLVVFPGPYDWTWDPIRVLENSRSWKGALVEEMMQALGGKRGRLGDGKVINLILPTSKYCPRTW